MNRGPGTDRIGDVGTSSRAGTRTNPPRASRPTPNPPAQVSRRKAPQQREKSPADRATLEAEIEEMIEEGLRAETEDEEEETPAPKPAKKRKRVPPTSKPTSAQLYERLYDDVKWNPMRFPDAEALHALGIYEDVRMILQNMGMESLLGMSYGVHKEASCETEGFGRISFKINERTYKVGFKKLSSILGFSDNRGSFLPARSAIVDDIWTMITGWSRTAGEDKSNDISNPGVRYAHKVLTHTFYSGREPGGANDDELKLLALGLLPILEEGTLLHTDPEDFEDLGLLGLLMKRFEYYRDWAWTTPNEKPTLFIGSFITPILEAFGIDLGPRDHAPASINLAYLKKTHFLTGQSGNRLTTLSDPRHVLFAPAAHELIPADFGVLETITKARKKKTKASSSRAARPSDADDEGPTTPATVYGTERYHFQPYGGVTLNIALRQALSQNAKLLRWNKMQDSTIYKLKNSVKALKRQMKKVTALLSQVSIGSGCQRDDVLAGAGPSTLPYPVFYGPPHSPEYRLRRRRRNTAPPPRASSNDQRMGTGPISGALITSQKPSRPSPIRYRKQLSIATQMALGEQIRNMRDFAGYSLMAPGTTINKGSSSRFMSPQLLSIGPLSCYGSAWRRRRAQPLHLGYFGGFLNLVLVLIHSPRLLSVWCWSRSRAEIRCDATWFCLLWPFQCISVDLPPFCPLLFLNGLLALVGFFALWILWVEVGVAPFGGLTIPTPYPTRFGHGVLVPKSFMQSVGSLSFGEQDSQLRMVVPSMFVSCSILSSFRPPQKKEVVGDP
ncbi:hypothetical protein HID58_095394 [Brassica napus]|uniref:Arabidopsis retrotransposon Orf1 C-terminal domain-containing protein n=1 Tax=Brassica napus TaxID=3708 RepID=A0ABQ7X3T6_BRANA|nr:hypothetical protein HID58_095394 [Brassica napus]